VMKNDIAGETCGTSCAGTAARTTATMNGEKNRTTMIRS